MSTQPTALAQLRHLYQNMLNGGVRDTASAKRIAEGLLGPVIEALERVTPATGGEPAGWLYDWFSDEGELVRDWFTTDHDEAHSAANQAHNIRALDYRGESPQSAAHPDTVAACIARLEQGGQSAAVSILRHHFEQKGG